MVMTTSEASTASGVRILGLLAVMSMPISFIASTATGLIWSAGADPAERTSTCPSDRAVMKRSEEHTSELQSRGHLVCRLLLDKQKQKKRTKMSKPESSTFRSP